MEGYSVTEAASVLGVPTERVWELLARGILSGVPDGEVEMRVFLKPRLAAPTFEATPRGKGHAETERASAESSPFRELLTEFRSLTERYGQALLALGEARGEVASLRSRVDMLEARMDLRLTGSGPSGADATWSAPPRISPMPVPAPGPDPVPHEEAGVRSDPDDVVAEQPAGAVSEEPSADDRELVDGADGPPPDRSTESEIVTDTPIAAATVGVDAAFDSGQDAAIEETAPTEPSAAALASEPREPPGPATDHVAPLDTPSDELTEPIGETTMGVEVSETADHVEVDAETDMDGDSEPEPSKGRKRGRGHFREDFAGALARADDPTPPVLPDAGAPSAAFDEITNAPVDAGSTEATGRPDDDEAAPSDPAAVSPLPADEPVPSGDLAAATAPAGDEPDIGVDMPMQSAVVATPETVTPHSGPAEVAAEPSPALRVEPEAEPQAEPTWDQDRYTPEIAEFDWWLADESSPTAGVEGQDVSSERPAMDAEPAPSGVAETSAATEPASAADEEAEVSADEPAATPAPGTDGDPDGASVHLDPLPWTVDSPAATAAALNHDDSVGVEDSSNAGAGLDTALFDALEIELPALPDESAPAALADEPWPPSVDVTAERPTADSATTAGGGGPLRSSDLEQDRSPAEPYLGEETMLWFGRRESREPGPSDTAEDAAGEMEVASTRREPAPPSTPRALPGADELDRALASLRTRAAEADAGTASPAASGQSSASADAASELRSPASRAYRRLRRIFPG